MYLSEVKHDRKTRQITCVYFIVCNSTGKKYVGSTNDFDRRMYEHLKMLRGGRHHSQKLQNAFNKYGLHVFSVEIHEVLDSMDSAIAKEQEILRRDYKTKSLLNSSDRADCPGSQAREVYGYREGHLVLSFGSTAEAAEFVGAYHATGINAAIRKRQKCKGYYWSCSPSEDITNFKRRKHTRKDRTPRFFAFKDGICVAKFASASVACKFAGLKSVVSIHVASKRGGRAGGYQWARCECQTV